MHQPLWSISPYFIKMSSPEFIVTITPQVSISSMSVFEIGTNKLYINHGKMQHEFLAVSKHIRDMISYFKQKQPKGKVGLAIAGFVLDQLNELDEETLTALQQFVQESYVVLVAVPYYGTALSVLQSQDLRAQLTLEHKSMKKQFAKRPEYFFAKDALTLAQEKVLRPRRYKSIITTHKFEMNEIPLLKKSSAICMDVTNFSLGDKFATLINLAPERVQTSFTETENHIKDELIGLYGHIVKSGDNQLLSDWRLIAQTDTILSVGDTYKDQNQTYENYMHLLNIFNDVAHRIRSVELSKRGEFLTEAEIVDSPTKLLNDLM